MTRRLFTGMALMCGIALTGAAPAEARLAWKGFSELCFELVEKGGPVTDGELTIFLTGLQVKTACDNIQNPADTCQPGSGNAGNITITVPAQSTDPTKTKGIITADGCLDLTVFDDHFKVTDPNIQHQHTCNPLTNANKVERLGSAYIPEINTTWILTNTNSSGQVKVIRQGFQTCFWPGTFNSDPSVCAPEPHDLEFVCPIDEILKK